MANNNNRKAGGLGFSIAGFIISVAVVFLVSLLDFIPMYFFDFSVIDMFFPLRFIIVAAIVAGVYSKFRRGSEGIIFAFLLMLAAFMLSIFADYIIMVAWAMLKQGFTSATLGYFTFLVYLKEYYYIGPTYFFGFELSGMLLLGLNILAYIVASLGVYGTIAVGKNVKTKMQQTEVASGEFLSRNAGADMANPFIQARMWTERGLVAAGHKTNPIYNTPGAMQAPLPSTPVASFAPAPYSPDYTHAPAPVADLQAPDYTQAPAPEADLHVPDYTQAPAPVASAEDLTSISSATDTVREMWRNNTEDVLDTEGEKNE